MTITFHQYLLPHGRQQTVEIERPEEIEEIAERFIASGGRYECEILTTGEVSITAVKKIRGEEGDVAIAICPNGHEVSAKVDEVVRMSKQFVEATA